MYPTIVSFFTPTWEYKTHASRLIKECEFLGLDYLIEEMEPTGSWLGNTRLKPKFILSAMTRLDRPLLWIDVDGSIYEKPSILQYATQDFMGRHQRTGPRRTWHVGTMFFNNTENGKWLLQEWAERANVATGSDEAVFESVWIESTRNLSYAELPEEYFRIIRHGELPPSGTVIAHRLSACESKMDMKRRKSNG